MYGLLISNRMFNMSDKDYERKLATDGENRDPRKHPRTLEKPVTNAIKKKPEKK